jgi:hypothetical protein
MPRANTDTSMCGACVAGYPAGLDGHDVERPVAVLDAVASEAAEAV